MSSAPRVSVVVACHNYGAFLAEALSSLARQSRPADELIVIDDGSTDETAAVLRSWSGPPVTLVSHPEPLGTASAFNTGIARSTGDLVVKLDADDRLSEGYLERLAAAIETTGAAIAYSGVRRFGAESGEDRAAPFDRRELMRENYINGSAMVRREVLLATGGYRRDFDQLGLEDWELWVHAVALGYTATPVEGCWLEYRRHAGGSRNTISRARALRAHLDVWWLHRPVIRWSDVTRWMARSARRNVWRLLRPSRA